MSARDTTVFTLRDVIEDALLRAYPETTEEGFPRREVDGLLAQHVHELVEKLRELVGPKRLPNESVEGLEYVEGWHAALDMIDPEENR